MKLIAATELWGQHAAPTPGPCGCMLTVGDPVVVDGLRGRGVIKKRNGRRLVVEFRSGLVVDRDQRAVHPL